MGIQVAGSMTKIESMATCNFFDVCLAGPLDALLNVPYGLSLIDPLARLLAVVEALLLVFQLALVLCMPLEPKKPR